MSIPRQIRGPIRPRARDRYMPPGRECELSRLIREGDREAEAEMASAFLPLVDIVAWRFSRATGFNFHEAASIGREALVGLMRRFDPSRGSRFSSFAAHRLMGAMLDASEREREMIRVPTPVLKSARRAERGLAPLPQCLAGRDASIAGRLEDARKVARPASIDRDFADDGGIGAPMLETLYYRAEADHPLAAEIEAAVASLPPKHRAAVRLYFGLEDDPLTMREAGRRMGLGMSAVSMMIKAALPMLRDSLERKGIAS